MCAKSDDVHLGLEEGGVEVGRGAGDGGEVQRGVGGVGERDGARVRRGQRGAPEAQRARLQRHALHLVALALALRRDTFRPRLLAPFLFTSPF